MMCLHHNASIQQNMKGICKLPKPWQGHGLSAKQAELVKALFECMPAFPLSHACIVTDKLQQVPPFDRLRTPLWVGKVQWRRGAKHATTRVQSHPPSTPSPR